MRARSGLEHVEPSIFSQGAPGRTGVDASPPSAAAAPAIPANLLRKAPPRLPEVAEVETVRHFTRLSRMNYGVDVGLYPLGSCTMKYNPRVCEDVAALSGFSGLHPLLPASRIQGALEVLAEAEYALAEITGMAAMTLAPAAGAHGELTGIKVVRAALEKRGEHRRKVLIPDTAHGTNPASCTLNGFSVVEVKSGPEGILEPAAVEALMDEDVAAIMVTNPNTIGVFESNLPEVARIVHAKGGFVYGDGANLNALMGRCRPASLGVDVIQLNLHKTFSTPHGGGGPGSGPVGVVAELAPFLPVPRVVRQADGTLALSDAFPDSIGRMRTFAGQFLIVVRALAYLKGLGAEGLKRATDRAVLNANYVRARLAGKFHLPYERPCMHEVVFSEKYLAKSGVHTMDLAKRLMDFGYHPPTVYFPLIVHGAIMIEPTETEDRATLDAFIEAMAAIADEAASDPDKLHSAPFLPSIRRPDEVEAARRPVLTQPL